MSLDPLIKALRATDFERENRVGLTASSLDQFEERVRDKLDIGSDLSLRVVLESDGTEIDDDDYFETLEPHTCLMVLVADQKWTPYKSNFILGLALETEGNPKTESGEESSSGASPMVEELVWRLHQDLSFFPWLTVQELERIAKMDREEMRNVVPDPNFLEFLQTLCERYLQEKDKSEDDVTINGISGCAQFKGTKCSTASILNDPLKLIRLYSKFNAIKLQGPQNGFFSFSSCGSEESLASLSINKPNPPQNLQHPPRPSTPRMQN